jgi:hypothetical protein
MVTGGSRESGEDVGESSVGIASPRFIEATLRLKMLFFLCFLCYLL